MKSDARKVINGNVIAFLVAAWAVFGLGCETAEVRELPYVDGTAEMVSLLRQIADVSESDPSSNVHLNRARLRKWEETVRPERPNDLIRYLAAFGLEQLRAGENEGAVKSFSQAIDLVVEEPRRAEPGYEFVLRDFLAITYMRIGEMENCLDNPSIDRCLLPITEEGVHKKRRGSEAAIAEYRNILAHDATDRNAQWLMNVAYMTLGDYPEGVPSEHLIPRSAFESAHDITRFHDLAPAMGIDVVGLSGGAVVDDFTGDGLLDIVASSWGLRDPLRFFRQAADGRFVDETSAAGLDGLTGGLNIRHADYDNDGLRDLFVLRGAWLNEGHPNSLLKNLGDGRFVDVSVGAGLTSMRPTQTAEWVDFNGDGWLDLFVGNESHRLAGTNPCELYRNNGDGTFTDIAAMSGIDVKAYVKGVSWGDYDNDGDPDLYVSSWESANLLFRNDGPSGEGWSFTDVTAEAGVGQPVESFPTWFFDYDNDGWEDLFVSGWRASAGDVAAEYLGIEGKAVPPRLYRNKGDGSFEDATVRLGLSKVMYTMGSNYGDLDNDGFLDFYVGTGDPDYRSLIPNRMFRNNAGEGFQEVTASGGFGHLQKGHGVSFADWDQDGDQDIYAVIGGAFEGDVFHNVLFENPGHGNRWITLKLEGRLPSSRDALGARVAVEVAGEDGTRTIHRTVTSGSSFGSNSLQLEIGLGDAEGTASIRVSWPSGRTSTMTEVQLDQILTVAE